VISDERQNELLDPYLVDHKMITAEKAEVLLKARFAEPQPKKKKKKTVPKKGIISLYMPDYDRELRKSDPKNEEEVAFVKQALNDLAFKLVGDAIEEVRTIERQLLQIRSDKNESFGRRHQDLAAEKRHAMDHLEGSLFKIEQFAPDQLQEAKDQIMNFKDQMATEQVAPRKPEDKQETKPGQDNADALRRFEFMLGIIDKKNMTEGTSNLIKAYIKMCAEFPNDTKYARLNRMCIDEIRLIKDSTKKRLWTAKTMAGQINSGKRVVDRNFIDTRIDSMRTRLKRELKKHGVAETGEDSSN